MTLPDGLAVRVTGWLMTGLVSASLTDTVTVTGSPPILRVVVAWLRVTSVPFVWTWTSFCRVEDFAVRVTSWFARSSPAAKTTDAWPRSSPSVPVVADEALNCPPSALKVTVALRDERDDKERRIQYRFFFFDERGIPENNNPDWRYKELPRRAAIYVDGNALDKDAVDWRLELRPAR